jgi:hypothetical protein
MGAEFCVRRHPCASARVGIAATARAAQAASRDSDTPNRDRTHEDFMRTGSSHAPVAHGQQDELEDRTKTE